MKQKMYIGAITLVIAGLLLTSTTGMGKPITPVTTATKIMDAEEITPAVRQEAFNGIVSMLPTEGIGALKNFNKITATHDHSVIASHVEQRNLANPNSISLPAQKVTNEKVVPVTYPDRRTRDGLLFWNTHPAVASNGAGMVMRVYEEVWQNESVPTENYMTLVYSGSNDGGVTWGPGFSFIDWIIGLPVPASMPTIDYWGKNGTLDVWTVSFRDGDDSGAFHLLTWKTNATTIIDLPNAIWDDIYWPSMGYSDLKNPEITCNNNYGPGFFGAIAMTLDHAGGNDQVYYFFANFSNPGQFHIFGWVVDSVTYTQGFDIAYDLDNPARLTFMCDEFANDQTQPPSLDAFTWGHFLDDTTSPGCGLPGWWDPSGVWSFEYPDLDMYNHTIVYALETYNQIEDPAKAHCYLEAGNYYDDGTTRGTGWFANDVVWYDPAGTYRFPEVEHVADQTFIMTCIHTNTTTQESELMFAVSIDDGVTWVGNSLYTWSGDDAVVPGYRGHTLSKGPIGAEIAIWEYVSTEDPDDDVIFLHNNFNTAVLNGHVTYLESEPVVTPDIQIYNIDPVDGFKKTITGDANGYYNIVLVRGFDIWTNATIRVIA
ncbi:MAG: hypothetical protein NT038_08535, partial [Euryarchaeota archaeon]|nr:hypothetical protein [Euryarchaeota archaeon]